MEAPASQITMNEPASHVWEILLRKPPAKGRLIAQSIHSERIQKIYGAIDAQQQRHILISLDAGEEEINDTASRGLSAVTRDLVITDGVQRRYIDIACLESAGHSAFDLLADEITGLLVEHKLSPSAATSRALEKWRRFWGRTAQQTLSRNQQLGLFAELWFLSEWLILWGGAEATLLWRGPFGDRHDFATDTFSVEVKATTSRRSRIYHVNGIDQLAPPSNGMLYFFGTRLRETTSTGESIPDRVNTLRKKLADRAVELNHLEEGLSLAGYSDFQADEYKKHKFEVEEACMFSVRDNFPRLTEDTVNIPPGVERIDYEINLDLFNDLIVAKKPAEWSP